MKAVLFDFDGTLADTMEDNFLAWQRAFKDYNISIAREDYFPLEGLSLAGIAEQISRKYSSEIIPEKLVELKNKYYLENNKFALYSEVPELIETLKNLGLKLAIVSASPREKLKKTAGDFLQKFDIVISGDDYKNGKPSPEPYLAAMKKMNLAPHECVVVENAPLGIKSAKSAGVYCFALATTLPECALKEADKILGNISELLEFIN